MIYIIFISISFLLFWIMESKKDTIDAYPLILVDGKVAPRLSPLPFHIENSLESNCLNCHQSEKNFTLNNKKYIHTYMDRSKIQNLAICIPMVLLQ